MLRYHISQNVANHFRIDSFGQVLLIRANQNREVLQIRIGCQIACTSATQRDDTKLIFHFLKTIRIAAVYEKDHTVTVSVVFAPHGTHGLLGINHPRQGKHDHPRPKSQRERLQSL